MRGMLAGVTAVLMPTGEALLDPTADEQREATTVATFGYLIRQVRTTPHSANPPQLNPHARSRPHCTHYSTHIRAPPWPPVRLAHLSGSVESPHRQPDEGGAPVRQLLLSHLTVKIACVAHDSRIHCTHHGMHRVVFGVT